MAAKKPSNLTIWGDDIGGFNISAYGHGIMGYRTANMLELPPRQSPESWTREQMMEKLKKNAEALRLAAHPG